MEVPGVVNLIAASCILHNICEVQKNEVLEAWINEATALPQPDSLPVVLDEAGDATDSRSAFKTFFLCLKEERILEQVHNLHP